MAQQRLAQPTRQSASQARFSSTCSLRVSNLRRPSHRQTAVSQQQLKPRELISAAVQGDFGSDDACTPPVTSERGRMDAYKPQSPLSASQSSAVVALAALAGLLAEQPYAPHKPTTAATSQSATSREPAPWDGWSGLQEAAPVTPTTAAPTGALPQYSVPVAAAQSSSAAASAKPAASQPRSSAQSAGPRRPGPLVKPGPPARRVRASNSRATGDGDSSSSGSSSIGSWAPVAAARSVPPLDVQAEHIPTSWNEFRTANKGKGWSLAFMGQMWKLHKEIFLTDTNTRSSSSSNVAAIAAGSAAPGVVAAGGSAIPTSWNEFQRANKGLGYSPSVMGQKWREHKAMYLTGSSSSSSSAARASGSNAQIVAAAGGSSDGTADTTAGPQSIPRTWNEFQKFNKGKKYSRAMMSQLWQEHKCKHGL